MTGPRPDWPALLRMAQAEVEQVLGGMAAALGERAREVAVIYQPRPTLAQAQDGISADLLGLFVGLSFPDSEMGAMEVSPQMFLFLENIWDEADDAGGSFIDEVRTTYLHELGHFLGLDEDDLEARGLE
ncbi:MAG: metallopeptidase family protein [Verrucomicrobia bacterium]|nr:metallopeptidase family protein [Verrucomicrobiota bacterium]